MQLTYFGANGWLLELANLRILVDPWLVGTLSFGGQKWLLEGRHPKPHTIPENIDLILLSQGLADHAHGPTLEQLDRSIPVVASASAAQVVQKLGYRQVTALAPGQTHTLDPGLEIRALPGAPVPQVENGYWLTDTQAKLNLYYEPHGFVPPDLQDYGSLDVAITPVVDVAIPVVGPIVKGHTTALQLAQSLKPKFLFATAAGGNIKYSGILDKILKAEGSPETLRQALQAENIPTQVLDLEPGQPYALELSHAQ
jgi:L-ascorbate metabolism protein UlaG (beta-lactamase superfamily)